MGNGGLGMGGGMSVEADCFTLLFFNIIRRESRTAATVSGSDVLFALVVRRKGITRVRGGARERAEGVLRACMQYIAVPFGRECSVVCLVRRIDPSMRFSR